MDNNLVNIDDLIRQRLGGAEEREPSGAWLRMRELLDEKDDRKPVGFIWRRMFGGLAVLALLASISLGGYQLTSHYRSTGSGNGTKIAMTAPVSHSSSAAVSEHINNDNIKKANPELNNTDQKHIAATVAEIENKPSDHILNKKKIKPTGSNIAVTNPVKHNEIKDGKEPQINHNHVVAASVNEAALPAIVAENTNVVPAGNTGIAKHRIHNHNPISKTSINNDAVATSINGIRENTTKSKQLTVSSNTQHPDKHSLKTKTGPGTSKSQQSTTSVNTHHLNNNVLNNKTGAKTTKPQNLIAATNTHQPNSNNLKNRKPVHKSATVAKSEIGIFDKNTVSVAGLQKQNGTSVSTPKPDRTSLAVKDVNHPSLGTDKTPSVAKSNIPDADEEVAVNKMALSTSHPAGADRRKKLPVNNPITARLNKNNIADKKLAATGSPVHAKGDKSTPDAKANKVDSKKMPVASSARGIAARPDGDDADKNDLKNKESLIARMANKLIPQIILQERIVQTGPHTYITYLDTISIGNINRVFDASDNSTVYGPPTVKQYMAKSGNAANSDKELIIPGASSEYADEEVVAKTVEKLAKTEKTKSKGGGRLAGSLEKALNDLKYSISGTRFAAGLKGGINGTFFGPNNFKGFQMGVTGNFIFSENVNILAELQYFQRINSGYIMNDDYYTYTQIGPNMWSRQQIQNPFSFSTLHSFEMPLIVRYTVKNFNFFAGGNLTYTLAVNESQGLPTPGATTQVAAVGNDTQPKIKESDFNGRFGLGYLFGSSVQLSPVISLDIRDVQTLWDNAGTSGSKAVSTQLFRSPSFQLSLGYRFGGKKAKQKE